MKPDSTLVVSGCGPLLLMSGCARDEVDDSRADTAAADECESRGTAGLTPALLQALLEPRSQLVCHVTRWVGNRAEAEDVVQEAYLRLLGKGGDLRRSESASAWFRCVVRTATIDHIRRREVEERGRLAWIQEMDIGSRGLPDFARANCECLRDELVRLRLSYAVVLRRVDLEDASIGEVAKELGMTPNGVRGRLHRARATSKRRLLNLCSVCGRRRRLECDCRERSAAAARAAMNGASVMSEVGDSSPNGRGQ